MKFLKIGLVLSAVLLFVFACAKNAVNNANSTVNIAAVGNSAANTTVAATNADNATTAGTDELASARKIYSEKCVNCHKEGGVGGVSTIDGKKIKAPNFTSDRFKKDDENDWIKTIHNGAVEDGMPAFKDKLSDDQIKSLVRLIRKDFQGMQ